MNYGVEVERVSKWFDNKEGVFHALANVSFRVGLSEFVSLIGPSGCGKSTLLRLVGGLLEPDVGSIKVEGHSPLTARRLKKYGFAPQHSALLPWRTVRGNVSLLHELNRASASRQHQKSRQHPNFGMSPDEQVKLLEDIGLGAFLDSYPSELSGGLRQRVNIARAFALGAPLMLMDEPFSSLDELTRTDMRYVLLELWRRVGSTVLFVTHSVSEAVVLSDRVIVMGYRPGSISSIVDVPLSRPRNTDMEDSEDYLKVMREVKAALDNVRTERSDAHVEQPK